MRKKLAELIVIYIKNDMAVSICVDYIERLNCYLGRKSTPEEQSQILILL